MQCTYIVEYSQMSSIVRKLIVQCIIRTVHDTVESLKFEVRGPSGFISKN